MIRTYKFRLKLKPHHEEVLSEWLSSCCEFYNNALTHRTNFWKKAKKSVGYYDQTKELTQIREGLPEYKEVPALVMRSPLKRLQHAFDSFFRRIKTGEKPGYPRYKSKDRFDSFGIGRAKVEYERVQVPKLGWIKFKQYRVIEGQIQDVSIKKEGDKWYVCISCDVGKAPPKRKPTRQTGIDLGLETFATLSDGTVIDNPRYFKKGQDLLAKRQRKLSKKKKGSNSRKKQKKLVAKAHLHIKNQRKDFCYKTIKRLLQEYDLIAIENLNIKSMIEDNQYKNEKSIHDAAWNIFVSILKHKAEEAGVSIIEVDPCNTSKKCSRCGRLVEKTLEDRFHECSCGFRMQRDLNAAINILSLGRSEAGLKSESTEVRL